MEGKPHRAALGALIAGSVLALLPSPAAADQRTADPLNPASASGASEEAEITFLFRRTRDGVVRARRAGIESSCDWHAQPFVDVSGQTSGVPRAASNARSSDDDELYVIWCGADVYLRWVGPSDFETVDLQPIVDEAVRHVSILQSGVQVRPDSRGITGIPSMFWVDGPGASPAAESVSAFGLTVTVSFALVGVEWDFGDGTPTVSGGLGEAYPERSSIQHTYRDASPNDVPYRVTATLTFQPSYSVSDGSTTTAGEGLAPIRVPVTRDYLVRQVQAIRKR